MEKKFLEGINYTRLEPVLLKINQNNINPSENITRKYNLMYRDFLKILQKCLTTSNPFLSSHLKSNTIKGKHLKHPDRQSYNIYHHEILIKLPSHLYKISVPKCGFIHIQLSSDISGRDIRVYEESKNWIDSSNFILPKKFNDWGQKIIMDTFNNKAFVYSENEMTKKKYSFHVEKAVPNGFNICIKDKKSSDEFEVRISFALYFESFPSVFLEQHNDISGENWIAAPIVPSQSNIQYRQWRYSFPNIEKNILTDQNYLKCVFRLIKRLREAAELTYLSNYHIKSIFLLQVKNQESSFWKRGLSYLFISMICYLQTSIESGAIPFYWNKNVNLLDDLSPDEIENTKETLNDFICKIYESFTLKQSVKLEDFFISNDDDDILSETMSICTLKND